MVDFTEYMTSTVLIQILLAVVIGYFLIRKIRRHGKYNQYPPSVKTLWLPGLGHLLGFGGDPVAFLMKQQKEIGDIFSFDLFGRDIVYLGSTNAVECFYSAPDEVLSAKEAYKFTIPAFGRGVVYDMEHAKFQEQRQFLLNSLTVPQFKAFVPLIEEEVTNYLDTEWKNEGTVDFYHAVSEMIMRASTRCLQGDQIRSNINDGYVGWMADIDSSLSVFSFFFPNFPLPAFARRDLARKRIGELFKKILRHRVEQNYNYDDFLEMLRTRQYKDGTKMSDDEIAGLSVALMLAGYHTSNITSSWMGIHLLTHPDVLKQVKEEQEKIVGNRHLDYQMIKDMELLDNCMSETLRLRPPIILIFRVAMQDFKVDKFVIPKGTFVCISPATRQISSTYTTPMEYDPMRFTRLEHKKENHTYLPFSTGKHYCIGEKFAYLQVKTIWSIILRRYDVKLIGSLKDYKVDNTTMMAAPTKPVKMTYKKIK